MGQVPSGNSREQSREARPPRFLIVGGGKVARHLDRYLSQLGASHRRWARKQEPLTRLEAWVRESSHVLLAVSDSAIDDLARVCRLASPDVTIVHFSGSLATRLAHGAHPLMSFPDTLFAAERYPRIPFVTERGGPDFAELLPGFPNPHFAIKPEDKPFYHALCVLSGNFTVLLWRKFFSELANRFGIPRDAALEYLRAVSANLEAEAFPLTGPLARGDEATIRRNLAALEGDPFRGVYLAFMDAFQASRPGKGESMPRKENVQHD